MNFPAVQSREEAFFLVLPLQFVDVARQLRRERMNLHATQMKQLWIDALIRDHPELVQAERDFYATRKKNTKPSEAGPSTAATSAPNRRSSVQASGRARPMTTSTTFAIRSNLVFG